MNKGQFIFSQITDFLPNRVFDRLVGKYNGNKYVRFFTCWNQLLCMMFGQLSGRESLRDLMIGLEAHKSKFTHLGLGKNVTRANLAKANKNRNYIIFEEFAYHMIEQAKKSAISKDFEPDIESNVYALDASIIHLCLNVFWWAEFRKKQAAIKIHALLDIKTSIPSYICITRASVHDVNILDQIQFEPGGYYIMDRGYLDCKRLFRIHTHDAYFVTRAKSNTKLRRMYSRKVDKEAGVLLDQTVKFEGFYPLKNYPQKLRKIRFYDTDTNKKFVFLTNNFELDASQVALLYKYRWRIELFFKWIKQHLKIKSFWGTTPNAVKIQIYSAIIAYCLVADIGHQLKTKRSTYEILQILGISLFDKTPIKELLTKQDYKDVKEQNCIQLKIKYF